MSSLIVIDANIALAQVLPLPYSSLVVDRMSIWWKEQIEIVVPALWEYEVVSGLRKAVAKDYLTQDQAFQAVEAIVKMGYEQVFASAELNKRALAWSETLGQVNAYHGQYLAVAESLGANFWTVDRQLANSVKQVGGTWVHWIGESED